MIDPSTLALISSIYFYRLLLTRVHPPFLKGLSGAWQGFLINHLYNSFIPRNDRKPFRVLRGGKSAIVWNFLRSDLIPVVPTMNGSVFYKFAFVKLNVGSF